MKYKYYLLWQEEDYVTTGWVDSWQGFSRLVDAQRARKWMSENPLRRNVSEVLVAFKYIK
jgi:hypothetical protein